MMYENDDHMDRAVLNEVPTEDGERIIELEQVIKNLVQTIQENADGPWVDELAERYPDLF